MLEDDDPDFCPGLHFLAIAFANQAFATEDLQSIDQLDNVRMSPPLRCQIFHCKESIQNVPVFRQPSRVAEGTRTSPDRHCLEIWASSFLCEDLGFCDGIPRNHLRLCDKKRDWERHDAVKQNLYSFQKIWLISNLIANSEHERMKAMAHSTSDTFDRNYLSQHVQELFQGQAEHSIVRNSTNDYLDRFASTL